MPYIYTAGFSGSKMCFAGHGFIHTAVMDGVTAI